MPNLPSSAARRGPTSRANCAGWRRRIKRAGNVAIAVPIGGNGRRRARRRRGAELADQVLALGDQRAALLGGVGEAFQARAQLVEQRTRRDRRATAQGASARRQLWPGHARARRGGGRRGGEEVERAAHGGEKQRERVVGRERIRRVGHAAIPRRRSPPASGSSRSHRWRRG